MVVGHVTQKEIICTLALISFMQLTWALHAGGLHSFSWQKHMPLRYYCCLGALSKREQK
jgi:hypothetical protein